MCDILDQKSPMSRINDPFLAYLSNVFTLTKLSLSYLWVFASHHSEGITVGKYHAKRNRSPVKSILFLNKLKTTELSAKVR